MTVLLHMSDPHFGTERPEVVEALVRLVQAEHPDAVLLSGDITQRATAEEFAAARAFVDRLGARTVMAIPGNHDIPLYDVRRRLFRPYERYRAAFGHALEGEWSCDDALVIAVNTTRAWRHKEGTLSPAQVEHVAQRVARARPQQLRVVMVHQPLAVYRKEDEDDVLHGAELAVPRWAEAGVDVVIGGHIHLPFVLGAHQRTPPLAQPLWVVQAGTSLSSRLRYEASNSVNLLRPVARADQRACHVERWDFRDATGGFQLTEVVELACGAVALTPA